MKDKLKSFNEILKEIEEALPRIASIIGWIGFIIFTIRGMFV